MVDGSESRSEVSRRCCNDYKPAIPKLGVAHLTSIFSTYIDNKYTQILHDYKSINVVTSFTTFIDMLT